MSTKFDLYNAPDSGINLVESSAGTGKTYNISGLVVRFLAENEKLSPQNILVVTFTNAATQELRDRIATRVREAVLVLKDREKAGDDEFLKELAKRYGGNPEYLKRLEKASRDMDQASIFTIHGFCQQALQEYVFESGSNFDTEYTGDDSELMQEAADDVWRAEMNRLAGAGEESNVLLEYMVSSIKTPDEMLRMLRNLAGKPYLEYALEMGEDAFKLQLRRLSKIIETMKANFKPDEIQKLLDPNVMNQQKFKPSQVKKMLSEFQQDFINGLKTERCEFIKLQTSNLKTKGGHPLPHHPFFDAVEEYVEFDTAAIFEAFYIRLDRLFKARFEALKEERRIRSFDDILTAMDASVSENQEMRMKLRTQYPVALVDEFQDTDPVQLGIFRNLYFDAGPKHCIYMIGDPKQSVYAFRGADIKSYLSVSKDDKVRQFTLGKNFRSTKNMVDAVNGIFSYNEEGHQWPGGLEFTPSEAHKAEPELFIDSDLKETEEAAMHIILPEDEEPLNKGDAETVVNDNTAREISRLLNLSTEGKATILESGTLTPLRPKHIAVLVRGHREADAIRKKLLKKGIKSVHKSKKSVFKSDEALFVAELLQIIKNSANPARLRMFLFGRMMGYRLSELEKLEHDSGRNAKTIEAFLELKRTFERQGFSAMLRSFLNADLAMDEGKSVPVIQHFLRFTDGERIYTNLMHINELIDQYEREQRPGLEELIKWINNKIETAQDSEDAEIRLESDDDLVQIVTMHSSKGLEYPIVFCTSLWSLGLPGGQRNKEPLLFYENEETKVDITGYGKDRVQGFVNEEKVAENIRLMYVSLTRARYRCYVMVGPYEDKVAGSSVLHFAMKGSEATLRNKKVDNFEAYMSQLRDFASKSEGLAVCRTISEDHTYEEPSQEVQTEIKARALTRELSTYPDWYLTSYSSISKKQKAGIEQALKFDEDVKTDDKTPDDIQDPDQSDAGLITNETDYSNIFEFPKGAGPGTFMHRLFEDLEFIRFETDAETMVRNYLDEDGFEPEWAPAILSMLSNSLRAKLPGSNARLIDKSAADTVDEMEFYFSISRSDGDEIAEIIKGGDSLYEAQIRRGFLNGFIDLLFEHNGRYYILDYKSDMIGSEPQNYSKESLGKVMFDRGYVFQYHIYLVALKRFLIQKMGDAFDYDKHIGGAYYLFLRGIDDSGNGIYFDNPDKRIIEKLDAYFEGGAHAARTV